MTAAPLPGRGRGSHPRLDWAAVGMAAVASVMLAVWSLALLILDPAEPGYSGSVGVILMSGALLLSIGAFALAVVARLLDEQWIWLWFPLFLGVIALLFPSGSSVIWEGW